MGHALDDFYQVVDRTGVAAMTLSPISTNAAAFYTLIGFEPYGTSSPQRMLLSAEAVMAVRSSSALKTAAPPAEEAVGLFLFWRGPKKQAPARGAGRGPWGAL